MQVTIVGLGKLGAPMAAVFARSGHRVLGTDASQLVLDRIKLGKVPVQETGLDELWNRNIGSRLTVGPMVALVPEPWEIAFVIVPTPSLADGRFCCNAVLDACRELAKAMVYSDQYRVVVVVSTLMPRQMDRQVRPLMEAVVGRKCGDTWGLCYNPEFIALGSVIADLQNPDYVLIGESDSRAGDMLETFYATLHDAPCCRMNFVSAEIAKLAQNVFLTNKITYANTLAELCDRFPGKPSPDVDAVTRAMGHDHRIGRHYLSGGTAYSGTCFPRDTRAFRKLCWDVGVRADQVLAVEDLNNYAVDQMTANVRSYARSDSDTIGILGLAYKPGTHLIDESASIAAARQLADAGVKVIVHDPMALDEARKALGDCGRIRYAETLAECVAQSNVLVLATPWEHYREELPAVLAERQEPIVLIDYWRLLRHAKFPDCVTYVPYGAP